MELKCTKKRIFANNLFFHYEGQQDFTVVFLKVFEISFKIFSFDDSNVKLVKMTSKLPECSFIGSKLWIF